MQNINELRNASAVRANPELLENAEALKAYLGGKREAEAHLLKLRKAWDEYFNLRR